MDRCPIFKYEKPSFPDNCVFNISPSQLGFFFSNPTEWYKQNVLGEEGFKGNTSSVLGTICHHIYEKVTLGEAVSKEEIDKQLDIYSELTNNPDIDVAKVKDLYPQIAEEVVNTYVLPRGGNNKIIECEKKIFTEVKKGVFVGGSCDRLEGDTVVDFKTVGKLPNREAIPFNYLIQLLCYAYIYSKMGYVINYVKIVYGIRPTKTIRARCVEVNHSISMVDWTLIQDILELVADSVLKVKESPELAYLLFKSMELKTEK